MSLLDKLLGRRPRTAAAIAAEIFTRKAILADARQRATATVARKAAALEAQDANALKAAEDDADAARRDAELAVHAIGALEAAHAEQVKTEEREKHRVEVEAAEREAVALTAFIQVEYPEVAPRLAALLNRIAAYEAEAERLHKRGRELREPIRLPLGVESFRCGPRRWRVTWPNPNGSGVIQGPPENAPRGAIRWLDGEPVAAREGVTVEPRPTACPTALLEAIKHLPGLMHGDAPIYHRAETVALPPNFPG